MNDEVYCPHLPPGICMLHMPGGKAFHSVKEEQGGLVAHHWEVRRLNPEQLAASRWHNTKTWRHGTAESSGRWVWNVQNSPPGRLNWGGGIWFKLLNCTVINNCIMLLTFLTLKKYNFVKGHLSLGLDINRALPYMPAFSMHKAWLAYNVAPPSCSSLNLAEQGNISRT